MIVNINDVGWTSSRTVGSFFNSIIALIFSRFPSCVFLDALASLDFKLPVSQSLNDSPFSSIKASASTGLSEFI